MLSDAQMLVAVKNALGIQGTYQDDTITEYIREVKAFAIDGGVPEDNVTAGLVSRGVSDLWSYGSGDGKLSEYFLQRVAQLSYKGAG